MMESIQISKVLPVMQHRNGSRVDVILVYLKQFGHWEFFSTILFVVIFHLLMSYRLSNVNFTIPLTFLQVQSAGDQFVEEHFAFLLECVKLIEQCLAIRSSERPTLDQCFQSDWLKSPSSRDLSLPLLSRRRGHSGSTSSSCGKSF